MDGAFFLSHVALSLGFFSIFVLVVIVRKALNAADRSETIASKPAQLAICLLAILGVFAAVRIIGVDDTGHAAYAFLGGALFGLWLGHATEPRRQRPKS